MAIDLICLDADDTLWHTMRRFEEAAQALCQRMEPVVGAGAARERLEAVMVRNLALYGYGAKSFTLSMLETASELCGDALPAETVRDILAVGRDLLSRPVELLPGVEAALDALAQRGRLVLVTKGDLFDQEAKLAGSGLGGRFSGLEIVSDKTVDVFRRVFARYGAAPGNCVMAGDSLRSDVLPALEAGAWAALVPYGIVWSHERAGSPVDHPRFTRIERLGDLPAWIDAIGRGSGAGEPP
jgi:putative hydrolase of the HAD superfamily